MLPIRSDRVLLALGANTQGHWGAPKNALSAAIHALDTAGASIRKISPAVFSAPIGHIRQPPYVNLIVETSRGMAPAALLRLAKRLEQQAGRRSRPVGSARPLDIDIIDYGGRRLGHSPRGRRPRGSLILPHPLAGQRGFVLVPLATLDPGWHPAGGGRSTLALLARHPAMRRGLSWTTLSPSAGCDGGGGRVSGRALPPPSLKGAWRQRAPNP